MSCSHGFTIQDNFATETSLEKENDRRSLLHPPTSTPALFLWTPRWMISLQFWFSLQAMSSAPQNPVCLFGHTWISKHVQPYFGKKRVWIGEGWLPVPGIILQTGLLPKENYMEQRDFRGIDNGMTSGKLPCDCCTLLDDKQLWLTSVKSQ